MKNESKIIDTSESNKKIREIEEIFSNETNNKLPSTPKKNSDEIELVENDNLNKEDGKESLAKIELSNKKVNNKDSEKKIKEKVNFLFLKFYLLKRNIKLYPHHFLTNH